MGGIWNLLLVGGETIVVVIGVVLVDLLNKTGGMKFPSLPSLVLMLSFRHHRCRDLWQGMVIRAMITTTLNV